MCFGFVSPHWQPWLGLAGSHDAAWREHRFPLLAADFDRQHDVASLGLIAPGYLQGNEEVQTLRLSPEVFLGFVLLGESRTGE